MQVVFCCAPPSEESPVLPLHTPPLKFLQSPTQGWEGCGWSRVPRLYSVCGFILPLQWLAVVLASSTLGTPRSALLQEPGQLEVGAHFPFLPWAVPGQLDSKCLLSEWVTDKLDS